MMSENRSFFIRVVWVFASFLKNFFIYLDKCVII